MEDFFLEGNDLHVIFRPAFQPQCLPFFANYDHNQPLPGVILDYTDNRNVTGHAQRLFINHYCVKAFLETQTISLEIGSAGVQDAFCLSTDLIGNGETPVYGGGPMNGVHLKIDANDLSMFGAGSFGAVVGNHILEHVACNKLKGGESQEEKFYINCDAMELVDLLDDHWLQVIKPGGILAQVFPDETPCRRNGSSSLFHDQTHNHMLDPQKIRNIIDRLKTPVEVIEFDTFNNNFSINLALRKK